MDQALLQKSIDLLGEKEVARIRAKASRCSEEHAPDRISSCQCNVCNLKRKGIDYFQWVLSQRGDWLKRELQGRMVEVVEETKEIQTMDEHSGEDAKKGTQDEYQAGVGRSGDGPVRVPDAGRPREFQPELRLEL